MAEIEDEEAGDVPGPCEYTSGCGEGQDGDFQPGVSGISSVSGSCSSPRLNTRACLVGFDFEKKIPSGMRMLRKYS